MADSFEIRNFVPMKFCKTEQALGIGLQVLGIGFNRLIIGDVALIMKNKQVNLIYNTCTS